MNQNDRPRWQALSTMSSLCVANHDMKAAEGYLLELLAWCAFATHAPEAMPQDPSMLRNTVPRA